MQKWLTSVLLSIGIGLALAGPGYSTHVEERIARGQPVHDIIISRWVRDALYEDPKTRSTAINVTTRSGHVVLRSLALVTGIFEIVEAVRLRREIRVNGYWRLNLHRQSPMLKIAESDLRTGLSSREVEAMSIFRFLPGIIILQIATAVFVVAAVNSSPGPPWALIGALVFIVSLLVAFWFRSIADHIKKDALARAKEASDRERERFLVTAEADKRVVLEESHKRIVKETNRVHAKANFKLGAAFAGMFCVATLMLSIQFITAGLLTLATAGGALAGYAVRARQDALALRKNAAQAIMAQPDAAKVIEAEIVEPIARLEKKSS